MSSKPRSRATGKQTCCAALIATVATLGPMALSAKTRKRQPKLAFPERELLREPSCKFRSRPSFRFRLATTMSPWASSPSLSTFTQRVPARRARQPPVDGGQDPEFRLARVGAPPPDCASHASPVTLTQVTCSCSGSLTIHLRAAPSSRGPCAAQYRAGWSCRSFWVAA